jgi:hypothetical protein
MVYPAVNSFTAAEPGTVAPPLTNMNNFVSYDSHHSPVNSLTLANNLGSFALPRHHDNHPSTVTPASIQTSGVSYHSPQSSLSHDHSDEGIAHPTPPPGKCVDSCQVGAWDHEGGDSRVRASANTPSRKRGSETYNGYFSSRPSLMNPASHSQPLPLFVAAVPLRPEHYRAVTPFTASAEPTDASGCGGGSSSSYRYPIIPLTFMERKRLSDTLFHLSRELPTATADCAKLLREARQAGEWDLAVAELLTQVIVGLYCAEEDTCLYGLQTYLLGLGIAC